MQKRAEPPQERRSGPGPAPEISGTYAASADEILQWLRTLPEGPPKELEKARLLNTQFRDLRPAPKAGRPPKHDRAAVILVVEVPLLQGHLRAEKQKRDLRRRPHLERHGLVSKPARRETLDEYIQRTTPVVLEAWRNHREAMWPWPEERSLQDPPEGVLRESIRAAMQKRRDAPDLAVLGARLLGWWCDVPPQPRAIRKLVKRGADLYRGGEGYF